MTAPTGAPSRFCSARASSAAAVAVGGIAPFLWRHVRDTLLGGGATEAIIEEVLAYVRENNIPTFTINDLFADLPAGA